MAKPAQIKSGADLPLGAFKWSWRAERAFQYSRMGGYWRGTSLEVFAHEQSHDCFRFTPMAGPATIAEIEATMRAHGVWWREP